MGSAACGTARRAPGGAAARKPDDSGKTAQPSAGPPFPSTYVPRPSTPTLIINAQLLTAAGPQIERGWILMQGGRIAAVSGASGDAPPTAPAGTRVIDAAGRWVTPGLIDVHSHLGVYAAPGVTANSDGNEATEPVTADVWAEHSVWPQDPQFPLALAGGVTSMQILPGSANLIGGRSVTVKNVTARSVQGMKFPGAPYGLKMACGENPKRVYGERNRAFSTRMGNLAGTRAAWIKAEQYRRKWQEYERRHAAGEKDDPPERDLELETLAGVLEGKILVHNHCYRADEMEVMLDQAREFGYKVAAFHHAVEAYKIADVLEAEGVCAAMWADWWGFKMEAYDGIRENIALVDRGGRGCAIVHSDSPDGIQRLNQEAAKVIGAAHRAGMEITHAAAIRWLTINPARAIGVADQTGSLEAGKMADVVLWSGDPFSVYTQADLVFVDGALLLDRSDPKLRPHTDFELGLVDGGDAGESR